MVMIQSVLEQARACLHQGQLAQAEALCRKALDDDPSRIAAWLLLAQVMHGANRGKEALALLSQALDRMPDHPTVLLERAKHLRLNGRTPEALVDLRRAVVLAPDNAEVHANLALALLDIGDETGGEAHLRRAIEIHPNTELLARLGVVLQRRSRLEEAEAAYRRALALTPTHVECLSNLALVLSRRGEPEAALDLFLQATRIAPRRGPLYANMAVVLQDLERPEEALAAAHRAASLNPEMPEVHNILGNILLEQNRAQEAITSYERALALAPTHAGAKHGVERVRHALGGINGTALRAIAQASEAPEHDDQTRLFQALLQAASYTADVLVRDYVAVHGTVVQAGPFAGMIYQPRSIEGCTLPKLIGSYEGALHPHIIEAARRGYEALLNIGSADGYYAVGLARLMPGVHVYAHDINRRTHRFCRKLAEQNGVADRITIGGLVAGADFDRFADRRTLIFCDIEGGEIDLLDPMAFPALRGMDVIVELHDCQTDGLSRMIADRFAPTHEVILVDGLGTPPPMPAYLAGRSHLEQLVALWEARPGPTPWGVFLARDPAPRRP